jgi:uncharacterized protein (DUF1501 family)
MLSRRGFLRSSTLLALAPSVPGFVLRTARGAAPKPDARVLVVVQLSGGNDGINTVVPYADEGYARSRKHLRLPTDRLLKIDDQLGFHPALGGFARLWETGRLTVIQGVGYPNPSRSHFRSMAYWQTARFDERNDDGVFVPGRVSGPGWLGVALDGAPTPPDRSPDSVFVGLRAPPPALRGRRCRCSALARADDLVLADDVDAGRAFRERGSESDVRAFVRRSTLDAYTTAGRLKEATGGEETAVRYPANDLGLRLVARLIKAGFGTRVYYVEQPGYDTHATQLPAHEARLGELGGALRAFLDDLGSAGLAERVAVMVFSEFGRRVAENGSYGTDHGTSAPAFLAGGAVKGGLVGKTPSLLDLEHGDLRMGIDFRRVYATVLEDWLGLPASTLGGGFEKLPLFRRG